MITNKSRIILALDVEERGKAIEIVSKVEKSIGAIKVNYPLVLSCGISIVKELSQMKPVICDFKVADVPHTNFIIARKARENGASAIIVHGFMGKESIEACKPLKTIVVAEMTNEGSREFFEGYSKNIIELAKEAGSIGLVAPATKPERIKRVRELANGLLIFSPGIGAQGGKAGEAIKNGADYIIVGRSIYQSDDPLSVVLSLNKEVNDELKKLRGFAPSNPGWG